MSFSLLYIVEVDDPDQLRIDPLYYIEGMKQVRVAGNHLGIVTIRGINNLDKIIEALVGQGMRIRNIATVVAGFADVTRLN